MSVDSRIAQLRKSLNVPEWEWRKIEALLQHAQPTASQSQIKGWQLLILAIADGSPLISTVPTVADRQQELKEIKKSVAGLARRIVPTPESYWLVKASKAISEVAPEAVAEIDEEDRVPIDENVIRVTLGLMLSRSSDWLKKLHDDLQAQRKDTARPTKPSTRQIVKNLVSAAMHGELPFDESSLKKSDFIDLINNTCHIARIEPPAESQSMIASVIKERKSQGS